MARRKPNPPRATRGNSRSTPHLPPPESAAPEPLAIDEALALFLRRPPAGADRIVVLASSSAGEQLVQDRSVAEARAGAAQLANDMMTVCERWARTEGKTTRFRGQWQAGERVLGSYQWQCGEGSPTELDGTVDSFLQQQQRHAETQQRLHHEGFAMVQDSWKQLLSMAMRRIESLERDLAEARDRLRKSNDVDAELAITATVADIDAKQRTAKLIEERLIPMILPIAQQLLLRQGAAPAGTKPENAEQQQTPNGRP